MSDSKKTSKTSTNNKVETKATKSMVVKKAPTKSAIDAAEERQLKAAIDKYKDIPLGELYEDLNGTEVYKDILKARREELLKAKSIADSGKRKLAIAKTSENTVDIEFKYQKNASFKNHYVPSGNYKVISSSSSDSDSEDGAGHARSRVLNRSQERTIGEQQYFTSGIGASLSRNEPQGPRQVSITSSLENRTDRPIAAAPMAAQPAQPAQQRPAMVRELPAQQPAPAPMQAAPMPQQAPMPMPAPAAAPMMQAAPMPQQAPAAPFGMPQPPMQQEQRPFSPVMTAAPAAQPVPPAAAQPTSAVPTVAAASVDKGELHKKHKLWPLYEKIELVSAKGTSSKVLFGITVTLSVILCILVAFFVLWGFAIHWEWDKFMDIPLSNAMKNLFDPLFK